MSTSDCCVVDHKRKKCVDIGFDDSGCVCQAKSCVGISNVGLHNKCTSAARKCRKLGNAWDPIAPLHPLPFDYLYTQAPGYATTGNFVEHFNGGGVADFLNELFDVGCVVKNFSCSLVIALVAKSIIGTKVSFSQLLFLTFTIALVKCCIARL